MKETSCNIFKMTIFSKLFCDLMTYIIRERAGKKIMDFLMSLFKVFTLYILHIGLLFVLNLEQGGRNPSPLYSVLQDSGDLRGPVLNNKSFPEPFVFFTKISASFVSFISFEFT